MITFYLRSITVESLIFMKIMLLPWYTLVVSPLVTVIILFELWDSFLFDLK